MKFIVSVTCCLLVVASLTVIVDCKVDIYHISEKLDNKLESFRFPTLPPWFPTGFPTGLPTGLPTIFPTSTAPEKEDKKEEQEVIADKDDEIEETEEIKEPDNEIDSDFDGKCPESGIKVIRHKSECGKYILCFGGVRIVRSCAPGLHWSSKLQSCTRPEISECEEEISVHKGCPKENDPDNLVFLPDYKNCSKYL